MSSAVSVVIPAYNEASRIADTLPAVLDYLNEHREASELILVDDGSSDETAKIAEETFTHAKRVSTRLMRSEVNRGKGHAVRTGLLAARSPIALFSDADLSTPITEMPKVVEPIERGRCDLVFGSRALDRSLIGVHQPWRRETGGRVFNLVVRLATGLPYWVTQCVGRRSRRRRSIGSVLMSSCCMSRDWQDCVCKKRRCAGITTREVRSTFCETACVCLMKYK